MTRLSIENTLVQESVNQVSYNASQTQTLSSTGNIDLSVPLTNLVQTGSTYTVYLPMPQYIGQLKTVIVGTYNGESWSPITISYNWSYYADPENVSTTTLKYLGDNQVFIGTICLNT